MKGKNVPKVSGVKVQPQFYYFNTNKTVVNGQESTRKYKISSL